MACLVFVLNLPVQLAYTPEYLPHVALVVPVGLCLPYVLRRDHPAATFAVMALVSFAQVAFGVVPQVANYLMVFLGLYNVAARCSRLVSVASAGVVLVGAVLVVLRWETTLTWVTHQLVAVTAFVVSVWIWGHTIGTRRAYLASLEERAAWLERDRHNQAQLAAATERARIAREMHDVISHSLSMMVVQADGATYALRGDPDRAERSLETVSETGRNALTEMRRMLGVLRDGESQDDTYTPQPGTAQLEQLVADVRSSGFPAELTVEGVPRELPAGMELAVFRVVQEALTNTRKHAGPTVGRVRVRLWYGENELEVRVSDDGRGAAALPADSTAGGHGLVGMHERVAAYGGSLHSGPRAGGGFEVVVSLPLVAV